MEGVITLVVVGVVVLVVVGKIREKQKREALKAAYEQALRGTDKPEALMAGRAYYSSLRKDKLLTTYDEAAINNDIATMKD